MNEAESETKTETTILKLQALPSARMAANNKKAMCLSSIVDRDCFGEKNS